MPTSGLPRGLKTAALDLLPVPVLVLDAEGTVLAAGAAAKALLGTDPTGSTFGALLHDDDADGLPSPAFFPVYLPATAQLRLRTAASAALGEPHYTPVLASARAEDERVVVALTDVSDDAARGAANEAHLLARAVQASDNSIVISDLRKEDQPLIFVNRGFTEITGYAPDEATGRNCRFLQVGPDGDRDEMNAAGKIREAIEKGEAVDGLLLRNYRKDGTTFWNELYLTPVRNPEGDLTHYIGVQNDVTERVEMVRQAQRREALLSDLVDALPEPVGLVEEREGGFAHLLGNAHAARLFGPHADAEAVREPDQGVSRRLDEAGQQAWTQALREAARGGGPVRFEAVTPGGDDEAHTYDVVVQPLPASEGEARRFLYVATDVSEGRRLEEEVLRVGARERRRVAHDLHDGLGQAIVGANMLAESLARGLESRADPAAKEAARLRQLVGFALDRLRAFTLGLDPVDFGAVGLAGALERLAAEAEALFGVSVTTWQEDGAPVPTPEARLDLYRIAQEAVTNAVRHGQAGRIEIRLEEGGGGRLALDVLDDGVGVPDEAARRGGLGLRSMGYRARRIGGELTVERRPEGGTRVRCEVVATSEALAEA